MHGAVVRITCVHACLLYYIMHAVKVLVKASGGYDEVIQTVKSGQFFGVSLHVGGGTWIQNRKMGAVLLKVGVFQEKQS